MRELSRWDRLLLPKRAAALPFPACRAGARTPQHPGRAPQGPPCRGEQGRAAERAKLGGSRGVHPARPIFGCSICLSRRLCPGMWLPDFSPSEPQRARRLIALIRNLLLNIEPGPKGWKLVPSSGKSLYYWSHFMDAEIKIWSFGDWPEASIPPAAPVTALTLSLSLFPPQSPSLCAARWGAGTGHLQLDSNPGPGSSGLRGCQCRSARAAGAVRSAAVRGERRVPGHGPPPYPLRTSFLTGTGREAEGRGCCFLEQDLRRPPLERQGGSQFPQTYVLFINTWCT